MNPTFYQTASKIVSNVGELIEKTNLYKLNKISYDRTMIGWLYKLEYKILNQINWQANAIWDERLLPWEVSNVNQMYIQPSQECTSIYNNARKERLKCLPVKEINATMSSRVLKFVALKNKNFTIENDFLIM